MGDRAAEGTGLRLLDVDVNPLVVARGIGEEVHALLGDLHPVGVAEVLADVLGRGDCGQGVACRIDGIAALVNALDRYSRRVNELPMGPLVIDI